MFQKAVQDSLVEKVARQIEEAILGHDLKPGQKLPSSRELQEMIGTSQGTVREALRVLEHKGLIEKKIGAKGGIFVKELTTGPISEGLDLLIRQLKISPQDLAEFRQVVEAGLIRLVCQRISPAEMAELKAFIPELKACLQKGAAGWRDLLKTEVKLRKFLIKLSGNRMYQAVLVPIHENIIAYTDKYLPDDETMVQEAFHDWCRIIEAIEKRDAEVAASITQDHIARFLKHIWNVSLQESNQRPDGGQGQPDGSMK